MRIGYPCINRSLPCRCNKTFRFKSYSESRLIETVEDNLDCLLQILRYNVEHNILFFRITSDLVPFASHSVCRFDWETHFRDLWKEIGGYICSNGLRISMHPDQFTLINPVDEDIFQHSVRELRYHARVLDCMDLDGTAKIQIHVGGVRGNKQAGLERFAKRFFRLDSFIRKRLVVENDDRSYTLSDCLRLNAMTGIPVLYNHFHHELNSSGESLPDVLEQVSRSWSEEDGVPMVDYSSQFQGERKGRHTETLDEDDFTTFLEESRPRDFDCMLEIKDNETSALKAIGSAAGDPRFVCR